MTASVEMNSQQPPIRDNNSFRIRGVSILINDQQFIPDFGQLFMTIVTFLHSPIDIPIIFGSHLIIVIF